MRSRRCDDTTLRVRQAPRPPVAEREIEMCEHKGLGHPDSIADGACEAAARELALAYQRAFGRVEHFNVDKGLLIGGQSRPRFGGGVVLDAPRLIVCGRASALGPNADVRHVVVTAAERYLQENLRIGARQFHIVPEVREGSENLKQVYAGERAMPICNDTSFGVGYAPYSDLEQQVLRLARALRAPGFRSEFPAAGDDFKIMGLRAGRRFSFTLAIAFVDRHVKSVAHYADIKRQMQDHLGRILEPGSVLRINALDDPHARDETGLYLTVTGLSAEMGDDGQVGRGNRVNGLITPSRPMSLEAAAGKNPVSHVGKIYNVLAHLVAAAICERVPQVSEANVQLLSRIGERLDRPEAVIIEVAAADGLTRDLQERISAVAAEHIAGVDKLTQRLVLGEFAVF